jgi:hypothetical protein
LTKTILNFNEVVHNGTKINKKRRLVFEAEKDDLQPWTLLFISNLYAFLTTSFDYHTPSSTDRFEMTIYKKLSLKQPI